MATAPIASPHQKWKGRALEAVISAVSFLAFLFFDLLDFLLCYLYRFADGILEGSPSECYCRVAENTRGLGEVISETLYGRRNLFREIFPVWRDGGVGKKKKKNGSRPTRWSDCGCRSCRSWQRKDEREERLHLIVKEPAQAADKDCGENSIESIIFLHGFLSSSSWWNETVFPNLSERSNLHCRMFAVDLLGFGRSPKPTNCLYTIEDHINMIELSVLKPFRLNSFHIVAHSMGCTIALALAAKYPEMVKSITLAAPPCFSSSAQAKGSYISLNRFAERKIWPPLLFGCSFMSWYEHLGRSICLIICRNHLIWEWIIKQITRREVHSMIMDLTKHTHGSAWHAMHNVICGGANLMDEYLDIVKREGMMVKVIHGSKDQLVPLECSLNIKVKVPNCDLRVITDANHNTIINGREKTFTMELEETWFSSKKNEEHRNMT